MIDATLPSSTFTTVTTSEPDDADWEAHRSRIEKAAREASSAT